MNPLEKLIHTHIYKYTALRASKGEIKAIAKAHSEVIARGLLAITEDDWRKEILAVREARKAQAAERLAERKKRDLERARLEFAAHQHSEPSTKEAK